MKAASMSMAAMRTVAAISHCYFLNFLLGFAFDDWLAVAIS